MRSDATTVDAYLASLPPDRRATLSAVREVINRNLPAGYVEGMAYGMIGWAIPLATFPHTYNRQPLAIAALASQKNGCSLYLLGVYGHEPTRRWFEAAWAKTGKKLDMGKSCVRFGSVDDVPLAVIGEVITRIGPDQLIAAHEAAHGGRGAARAPAAAKPARAKPATAKKPTAAASKPTAAAAKKPAAVAKKPDVAARRSTTAAKKPAGKKPGRARA